MTYYRKESEVGGVLAYKTSIDGEYIKYSSEELTFKIKRLEGANLHLTEQLNILRTENDTKRTMQTSRAEKPCRSNKANRG